MLGRARRFHWPHRGDVTGASEPSATLATLKVERRRAWHELGDLEWAVRVGTWMQDPWRLARNLAAFHLQKWTAGRAVRWPGIRIRDGASARAGQRTAAIIVVCPGASRWALAARLLWVSGLRNEAIVPLWCGRRYSTAHIRRILRRTRSEFVALVLGRQRWPDDVLRYATDILWQDPRLGAVVPHLCDPTGTEWPARWQFDLIRGDLGVTPAEVGAVLGGPCLIARRDAISDALADGAYSGTGLALDLVLSLFQAGMRVRAIDRKVEAELPGFDPRDRSSLVRSHGHSLRRRVLRDLISGGGAWAPRPLRVKAAAELEPVCESLGWLVVDSAEKADVSIAASGEMLGVCWEQGMENRAREVALPAVRVEVSAATAARRPERLRAALIQQVERRSLLVQVGVRDWRAAQAGGDLWLATSLTGALRRIGWDAVVGIAGDPRDADVSRDVVLHIRGRGRARPLPGRFNVVWQISHPFETPEEELREHDLILVASATYAEQLAARVPDIPVRTLHQFADQSRFFPDPHPGYAHELVFVGNWRGVFRRIVADVLPTDRDLALYGQGWDKLVPEHAATDYVPPEKLRRLYSSAGIVLSDHWDDMRTEGFVSNRVFDALACGACVISDDVRGIKEMFEGHVATYRTPEDLRATIDRLMADPETRLRRGQAGRHLVLAHHTADHRASQLVQILEGVRDRGA